jgi:hypothetical protein
VDRSLRKMLKQTIIVRAPGAMDGAGEQTYGPQIVLKSFITAKNTFVRTSTGEFIQTQMMVVVEGDGQGIAYNWEILLPNGHTPAKVTVLPLYDENGKVDHTEIYI